MLGLPFFGGQSSEQLEVHTLYQFLLSLQGLTTIIQHKATTSRFQIARSKHRLYSRLTTMKNNTTPKPKTTQEFGQTTFRCLHNPLPLGSHSPDKNSPNSSRIERTLSPVVKIRKQPQKASQPYETTPVIRNTSANSVKHNTTPKQRNNNTQPLSVFNQNTDFNQSRNLMEIYNTESITKNRIEIQQLRQQNWTLRTKIKEVASIHNLWRLVEDKQQEPSSSTAAMSELKKLIVGLTESQYVRESLSQSPTAEATQQTRNLSMKSQYTDLLNKVRSLEIENDKMLEILNKKEAQRLREIEELRRVNKHLLQELGQLRQNGGSSQADKGNMVLAQQINRMLSQFWSNIQGEVLGKVEGYVSRLKTLSHLMRIKRKMTPQKSSAQGKDKGVVEMEEAWNYQNRQLGRVREQLKAAQSELNTVVQQYESLLEQITSENSILKVDLLKTKRLLQSQEAKFDELTHELEEYKEKTLKRLTESMENSSHGEMIKLQTHYQTQQACLNKVIDCLRAQLKDKQEEYLSSKEQISKQLMEGRKREESLKLAVLGIQKKLDQLKTQNQGLKDETSMVPQLKERILILENQLLSNQEKLNELASELNHTRKKISEQSSGQDQYIRQLEDVAEEIQNQLHSYQRTKKNLENRIREQNVRYTRDIDARQAKIQQLEETLRNQSSRYSELDQKYRVLFGSFQELKAKIGSCGKQNQPVAPEQQQQTSMGRLREVLRQMKQKTGILQPKVAF